MIQEPSCMKVIHRLWLFMKHPAEDQRGPSCFTVFLWCVQCHRRLCKTEFRLLSCSVFNTFSCLCSSDVPYRDSTSRWLLLLSRLMEISQSEESGLLRRVALKRQEPNGLKVNQGSARALHEPLLLNRPIKSDKTSKEATPPSICTVDSCDSTAVDVGGCYQQKEIQASNLRLSPAGEFHHNKDHTTKN